MPRAHMNASFVILSVVLCVASARGDLFFEGYMISTPRPLFVLSVDRKMTSGWVAVGQSFDGFSIVAFDAKAELLTVEKEGKRQVLQLVEGKIRPIREATRKVPESPVTIFIGKDEKIIFGDDMAMIPMLRAKFALVAAMVPQPLVTIETPSPSAGFLSRIRTIVDLCKAAGITGVEVMKRTPNQAPEPTPPSVTPRATEGVPK